MECRYLFASWVVFNDRHHSEGRQEERYDDGQVMPVGASLIQPPPANAERPLSTEIHRRH
jgi:hypothetical protein